MSVPHVESMAARLAVLMNGGVWDTHYTERQKQVWRDRVAAMWGMA